MAWIGAGAGILILAAATFAVWVAIIRPIDAAARVMGVVVPPSSSAPTRYDIETAF